MPEYKFFTVVNTTLVTTVHADDLKSAFAEASNRYANGYGDADSEEDWVVEQWTGDSESVIDGLLFYQVDDGNKVWDVESLLDDSHEEEE
jgi:hypothetical protein